MCDCYRFWLIHFKWNDNATFNTNTLLSSLLMILQKLRGSQPWIRSCCATAWPYSIGVIEQFRTGGRHSVNGESAHQSLTVLSIFLDTLPPTKMLYAHFLFISSILQQQSLCHPHGNYFYIIHFVQHTCSKSIALYVRKKNTLPIRYVFFSSIELRNRMEKWNVIIIIIKMSIYVYREIFQLFWIWFNYEFSFSFIPPASLLL